MLTPGQALERTGIPSYFGAWFAESPDDTPPDQYIVYTMMTIPDAYEDDRLLCYAVYAYVNLWTPINPRGAIALVRAEMAAGGWEMVEERIEHDDGGLFLVAWTWKAWEGADNGT